VKWQNIFETGIKLGRECDLRNFQDPRNYRGGYSDCVIINGDPGMEIKKVYVAVDIKVSEILLVKELNRNGAGINGLISHHPMSSGAYRLTDVVEIQKYNWERYGVDKKITDVIVKKMVEEENIELRSRNFLAVESASRLLEIPVLCIHTAIDNVVQDYFEKIFKKRLFGTLGDAFKKIESIPECIKASVYGDGPFILENKNINDSMGKIMVDMTGGIDPDSDIFKSLKKAGINTLIAMHYNLDNIKSIKKNKLNAIICGHMACDSIGLNIYSDLLEKNGIEIIAGSGFYRYKRTAG
jgi:putative NIF3 family GTP cyclohydrolase 1 type 2